MLAFSQTACSATAPACDGDGDGESAEEAPGATVCVVDDDLGVRDSLSAMLEAHGFSVATCASGSEFLAARRCRPIACLIIDQHMPEMTGLDVLATMQRQGSAVPAILVTGGLNPAMTRRARELGVTAVLEKPFAASRVIALVQTILGRGK